VQTTRPSPQKAQAKRTPLQRSLSRLFALKIVFLACFVYVGWHLVRIQLIESAKYKEIARRQYEAKVPLPATRGNMYDRNGKILVSSAVAVSYAADPKLVGEQADALAWRFADVFGGAKEAYLAKLRRRDARFVWLERRAKQQTVNLIRPQEFDGLIVTNEPQRIYHYDQLAGQLLGFTDIDNNGLSGIELQYDRYLRGKDGYMIMQRDGLGRKRPSVDLPRVEPVNGNNIVLTIDLDCQSIAEEELRNGILRNNAESGLVVMLDPKTGEVLAMASYPGINPNRIPAGDLAAARNRAITDVFEPGSLFKLVVVSAALEHRLVSPSQKFDAERGFYTVRGREQPITDVHKYGLLTLREAMELSSNIVMAKVADIVGAERFYTMARNFGFGTPTGIELPGEVSGSLKKPMQWSGATLNTMAYGYEVSVTPLQLAAAYAAIANGGVLMKPYIVRQILDEHNNVVFEATPQTVRRVVARSIADSVRAFLRGVVERGTGTNANTPVIPIAGKTGTSRKYVDGAYSMQQYRASFVGMFPADDPRMVCLVVLENPKAYGYYSAYTSAPIVKNIAEKVATTSKALTFAAIAPTESPELIATPDVRTLSHETAASMLSALDLEAETSGEGEIVIQQKPLPGEKIRRGSKVLLTRAGMPRTVAGGYTVVPDVRGMSLRRALNRLLLARLDAYVEGSGIVVAQSIEEGAQVKAGTRIVIRLESKRRSTIASL